MCPFVHAGDGGEGAVDVDVHRVCQVAVAGEVCGRRHVGRVVDHDAQLAEGGVDVAARDSEGLHPAHAVAGGAAEHLEAGVPEAQEHDAHVLATDDGVEEAFRAGVRAVRGARVLGARVVGRTLVCRTLVGRRWPLVSGLRSSVICLRSFVSGLRSSVICLRSFVSGLRSSVICLRSFVSGWRTIVGRWRTLVSLRGQVASRVGEHDGVESRTRRAVFSTGQGEGQEQGAADPTHQQILDRGRAP